MSWTPDMENKLRVLWTQGLSCSQIAKQIGGVTRNAVIGKRVRMGLPDRAEPNRSYGPRKPRANRVVAAPSAPRLPRSVSAPQLNGYGAKRPPLISERSNPIRFLDHKDFIHCAMFCEGESGDAGLVCGNPAREGSVYCSECSRVSYVPGSALAGAKVAA